MPREIIMIQCGQCGNQVGCKFWEMALREHASCNRGATFDHSLSSFFRNMDSRYNPPMEITVGDGGSPIHSLKARAVLIDMEEGVVNQLLKGPLSDLFDSKQYITGISGSGNNWAHGHDVYGPQYGESILEKIRHEVEPCESLQGFFMLHSLGGGTGSGLGSYVLELLHDVYPEIHRITTSVFPSADDDVVTSPYNSLLSVGILAEHADCVLPIENQALLDLLSCTQPSILASKGPKACAHGKGRAFDEMNAVIANLLLHMTSSMRFEGSLNVDLNEIRTNLIPFPRLHFLVSSLAPISPPCPEIVTCLDALSNQPRVLNQGSIFSNEGIF